MVCISLWDTFVAYFRLSDWFSIHLNFLPTSSTDQVPATGTGTLIIQLQDVNDNPPVVVEKVVRVCNEEPAPVLLTVIDKDIEGNGPPYYVQITGDSAKNWTARMNNTSKSLILHIQGFHRSLHFCELALFSLQNTWIFEPLALILVSNNGKYLDSMLLIN